MPQVSATRVVSPSQPQNYLRLGSYRGITMIDTRRIRVFLADDHVVVREGLASLLAKAGPFDIVGECGDGLKVTEQVCDCHPDVVVLDITMPGLNGVDICRELSRKARGAAVLILSMHDNEQFIVRALEQGASGYLLKECAGEQLCDAIQAVARGEIYLGAGISAGVLDRLAQGGQDPYDRLTTRERQVLQMIAEGMTNRMVGKKLHVAVKTVDTHRMRLMNKLDIHDQTNLVKFAIRKGLVPLD